MALFLHVHALKQMERRRISRQEVEEALESPETTYTSQDSDDRIVVLGKTAAGRPLKVVVEAMDREAIITVAGRGEEA